MTFPITFFDNYQTGELINRLSSDTMGAVKVMGEWFNIHSSSDEQEFRG